MLLKELRKSARRTLTDAGIETPALDADLLLGDVLGYSKTQLITKADSTVDAAKAKSFAAAIERRAAHEPVAYILGRKYFYEHEFLVSPAVLIPRPETELLVQRALECLKEELPRGRVVLIDVGTGSGAIVLSIVDQVLKQFESDAVHNLEAFGLDISEDALKIARENAKQLNLGGRVALKRSDLLDDFDTEIASGAFVLIVANLPYIPVSEDLPAGVKNFEPEIALRAGPDGMQLIERLMTQVLAEKLFEKGRLLMEVGRGQHVDVNSRLFNLDRPAASFLPDLQQILRVAEIPF